MRWLFCVVFGLHLLGFSAYPSNVYAWTKNSVKIITSFGASSYSVGYGLVINGGLILTSASLVFGMEKQKDIVIYNNEFFGDPLACISHGKILAIDDGLDLALLEPMDFTDIYCNILPNPNFRSIKFKENFYNLLVSPKQYRFFNDFLLAYPIEGQWSNFVIKQISYQVLQDKLYAKTLDLPLGLPLFIDDDFYGLLVHNQASKQILSHDEIIKFICKIQKETFIFSRFKSIENYCKP